MMNRNLVVFFISFLFFLPFVATASNKGNKVGSVILENIEIKCPGRATKGQAYIPLWRVKDVPEQISKYPEFSMFGELPAYGFYLRHAKNITMKNVKLVLDESDYRPAIVADDVESLVTEKLQPNDVFQNKFPK